MTRLSRPTSPICAGPITLPEDLPRANRPYFARAVGRDFDVHAREDVTEIDLYDEIGPWGVTASDFRERLRSVSGRRIRLRINSPGGDVFDGIAIHNDLEAHPATVEVQVTGVAASAASIIAMAGDHVHIASNAFIMIHNAWGVVMGNRNDCRSFADVLQKIDAALAITYQERTSGDLDEIVRMMDEETWLDAETAVELGFADTAGEEESASALFDLSTYQNVPETLPQFRRDAGIAPTKTDFERGLRNAVV